MDKENPSISNGAIIGHVDASQIPGVIVRDGQAFGEVGGRLYPVIGAVVHNGRLVPLMDIPMVDTPPGGTTVPMSEEVTK